MLAVAVCLLGLAPASARADWLLYLSGSLGMASGTTSIAGSSVLVNPTPPGRVFGGTYSDSSPLISGAFGVAIPLNETTAWELPYDIRLPTWTLRFETDVTGLRSFEGLTNGPTLQDRNFGQTETWSMVFNLWQDVPLGGVTRLLAKLPGRTPRWVRQTLDKSQIYVGGGIGVAGIEIDFTDNTHFAQANNTQFAWQAGTGFSYALTRIVSLDLGYRYFDYGAVSTRYVGIGTGVDLGFFALTQTSHEFRGGLRVNFWGFRPWR